MENLFVVLALVIIGLVFYIYHRGVAGAQTDLANAKASTSAEIADLKTHVLEVKTAANAVVAAVTPTVTPTVSTPPPATPSAT